MRGRAASMAFVSPRTGRGSPILSPPLRRRIGRIRRWVAITPETGSMGMGLGGFQETEQLPIFSKITKFQGHVSRHERMAEMTARCFDYAMAERGPTQLNIPRDFFYGEADYRISSPRRVAQGAGSEDNLQDAADLLAQAKFPVIVSGGGVIFSGGVEACKAWPSG